MVIINEVSQFSSLLVTVHAMQRPGSRGRWKDVADPSLVLRIYLIAIGRAPLQSHFLNRRLTARFGQTWLAFPSYPFFDALRSISVDWGKMDAWTS